MSATDPAHDPAGGRAPGRHYDEITSAWSIILGDDFHHGLFDASDGDLIEATENLTRAMAAAAEPPPSPRIVDLGCGTGTQACWLAERYPGSSVVGVTTSAVGVAAARRRAEVAGRSDAASFVCADALESGLPGAAFDVAWLIESSQYIVPRSSLVREVARLLVPGGRMALCDVMLTRPLELRDLRRLHTELDVLRSVFGEAVMGTLEEYRAAASTAGLQITEEKDLSARVLPTFGCWRERARSSSGTVGGMVGEGWIETFIAGCDVMERFFSEGIVVYSLISARRGAAPEQTRYKATG